MCVWGGGGGGGGEGGGLPEITRIPPKALLHLNVNARVVANIEVQTN